MPPPPPPPGLAFLQVETITSLIIVIASLIIYYTTKELYELTSHKGIQYFRYGFLFFGISFLVQFIRPILHFFTDLSRHDIQLFVTFFVVYAGTMAVLCLLYSVLWKKVSIDYTFLFLNLLAVLLASVTFLGRFRDFILILQAVLFVVVILICYLDRKKSKKKNTYFPLYIIYTLLFLSWIANVAVFLVMHLSFIMGAALNIVSALIFLCLLYKVLRVTHMTHQKKK